MCFAELEASVLFSFWKQAGVSEELPAAAELVRCISEQIHKVNSNKSSRPDGIHSTFLKEFKCEILRVVCNLSLKLANQSERNQTEDIWSMWHRVFKAFGGSLGNCGRCSVFVWVLWKGGLRCGKHCCWFGVEWSCKSECCRTALLCKKEWSSKTTGAIQHTAKQHVHLKVVLTLLARQWALNCLALHKHKVLRLENASLQTM